MAIRFARGTPWEFKNFKLRGISTTKSTRSALHYEEKSGRALLYTLQVGNPACCAFKFALVSEVRLHGRSIERKLINKDNNLTLKTHTK
jgi:hypothetical protein